MLLIAAWGAFRLFPPAGATAAALVALAGLIALIAALAAFRCLEASRLSRTIAAGAWHVARFV